MDKLMDNHWFLRGIALLLALMLYMVANLDKQPQGTSALPLGDAVETIQDVKVEAYYDQDKYVVTGLPQSVDITLEGSNTSILQTKMKEQFEVFTNLHGYESGTYEVALQYNGIPDSLKVKLQPAKVRVTIEPKKTKAFPVEVGYLNKNQMKSGYVAEKATVKPSFIEIAGTEAQLEQVGAVRAYIDLKGVNETFTKEAKIVIYDKSGNTLNLQANPSVVNVTVPVATPEKTLPIKITQKGELQKGLTLKNITMDPTEIKVYGPKEVLDSLEALEDVVVDLSQITDTVTFDAAVAVPKGAISIAPAKVKVTVNVQADKPEPEQRTLDDIPIKVTGLDEDAYELNFLDPSNGKVSVDAIGESESIEKLDPSDVQVSVNVENLEPGTHDVAVQISGPDNITFELKQKNAKVEIVDKS
ncbi:CdaR family protein [Ectobacillus funiculus]|uniref:YbbR-like domain-containing protein n=1 Tax=Ectobacillus funiculus TaxID=137993 RepID=A0ABV5WH64_9BACI